MFRFSLLVMASLPSSFRPSLKIFHSF